MKGYLVALTEILLFFLTASSARSAYPDLNKFSPVTYYWFCFTVLTGIWEMVYISNYDKIAHFADKLVQKKETVWTMDFPVYYVLPNFMSQIFYAEYGANADREYKREKKGDYWSKLIESSHALCCAAVSLCALLLTSVNVNKAIACGCVAMGMQFMNSLLYMGEYFEQCQDPHSVNFISKSFPLGKWMSKRWFMWVNLPWLVFPSVIIAQILI
jgi:hypothetical protein